MRVVYQNEKTPDWDLEARPQVSGYENCQLELRKTKSSFLAHSNYQNSDARNEINDFHIKFSSAREKLFLGLC